MLPYRKNMDKTKGYVLIAGYHQHYVEMAVNAACSLKENDNKKIALLKFGGVHVPETYNSIFDYIIDFEPNESNIQAFTRSFYLDKYTPFTENIYVDSDSYLITPIAEKLWDMCAGRDFLNMADTVTEGMHFRNNISAEKIISIGLCKSLRITNIGVFYFRVRNSINTTMDECRRIFNEYQNQLLDIPLSYYAKPGQLSDEPIWAIAMANTNSTIPFNYSQLIQATTPNTRDLKFDFHSKKFSLTKGGLKNVTGFFCHFCGLQPLEIYLKGMIHFRETQKLNQHLVEINNVTYSALDIINGEVSDHIDHNAKVYFKNSDY